MDSPDSDQASASSADLVEITPEMEKAGLDALRQSGMIDIPLDSDVLWMREIYSAMEMARVTPHAPSPARNP